MEIPECLIHNILIRLPIKSTLRFRAVCKSWYAILSNPEIVYADLFTVDPDDQILYKHHLNRTDEVFSLNNLEHISPPQKLPQVKDTANSLRYSYTSIAGCCNGIVLLQDGLRMCLWNPATGETKFLPEFNLVRDRFHDFSGDWHNVGFGFDAETSDFKVILIFDPINAHGIDYVYSLKRDGWKIVEPRSPRASSCSTDGSAMNSSSGNMCHWFGNYLVENNYEEVILSFDANREMFKTTVIPNGRKGFHIRMDYGLGFFMLKDFVAMFCEREKGTKMYEIWAMLEIGVKESWIKVITIGPIGPFSELFRFWTKRKVFLEKDGVSIVQGSEETVVIFDTFTGQTSTLLHNVSTPRFMLATNYKKSQVQLEELSAGARPLTQ